MITDFFNCENPKVKKYDYFEYHPSFLQERLFSKVYQEVKPFYKIIVVVRVVFVLI